MTGKLKGHSDLYGLLAQFSQPETLREAARAVYAGGFRQIDAFSPFPVEGLAETIGRRPTGLPLLTLIGGILGGLTGYFMQYYACVISYPINVGGRPYHSWPSFIPITFELTVLGASFFAVLSMLGLSGLPMPYHPLFNVPEFKMASRDQFFLCIEAIDPLFDIDAVRNTLTEVGATAIYEVPR